MNHCNSKKCVMLELTELSSETTPSKLVNGNVPHASAVLRQNQVNKTRKRIATFATVLVILGALTGLIVPFALQLRASSLLEARLSFIKRLLVETPLIDGHWNTSKLQTNGAVAAHFWPVLVPCGAQFLDAVQLALEGVDQVHRFIKGHSGNLELVQSASDLEKVHLEGRVAVLLGVEGGHTLGDSLGVLRSLYLLGARFLTLTHSCSTVWAETAEPPDVLGFQTNKGLGNFGKTIVKEMNRLGMLVDLSHVSVQTMQDVLSVVKAPVVFSHSGAQALCNASINVPDVILSRLAVNGGVVMVNVRGCSDSSLSEVISHINYIRSKTGVDHVGLGWDSDEMYPFLLAELARDRNWGTANIRKLIGENLIRVLREVERVRDSMRNVAEAEDLILADELDGKTYCRYPGA